MRKKKFALRHAFATLLRISDRANYSHRRIINCGPTINIIADVYDVDDGMGEGKVVWKPRNAVALYRSPVACLLSPIGFDIPTYLRICAREDDNGGVPVQPRPTVNSTIRYTESTSDKEHVCLIMDIKSKNGYRGCNF